MCWQCHKRAPMPWNPQIQEVICLACVWCVSSAFEWSIHCQPLKELALLFRGDGSQVVCTPQIVSHCCWGSAEAVRRLCSWRSQVELAEQLGTGLSLSQALLTSYDALMLDLKARSSASSHYGWEHTVRFIWLRGARCDGSWGRWCQQAHLLLDPWIRCVSGCHDLRHSWFGLRMVGVERGTHR